MQERAKRARDWGHSDSDSLGDEEDGFVIISFLHHPETRSPAKRGSVDRALEGVRGREPISVTSNIIQPELGRPRTTYPNKMEEVSLRIGNKVFKANKELLCEYSDYFRAMFSGNYVESEKQEINIGMLDPIIMSIILKYMHIGMILLSEYPLSTIGEIAIAANFLQITELIKQIQYVLDIQLTKSNWLETMTIAQNASYAELEQYSAAYGLYSFNSMKPEYIPTIDKLVWYLCHPYLGTQNEMHVFKFGFKWLHKNCRLEDMLLIFACLDMRKVTNKNLIDIREFLSDYVNHFSDRFVLQAVDCLIHITSKDVRISELSLCENKTELCDKFSESVWSELISIVKQSRARLIKYVPVVPILTVKDKDNKPELVPYCLYTFEENKGFDQFLEVAEKNLWGWNIAAWGLTKLVVVCGEHGRGTGIFMRDVKVYDTLKKKWTQFGVQLPPRRHAGVTAVGDLLYIIGGVGEFRVVLETAVVYDLKERSCRKIAKLPDAIQSPAVCTHNNKVYAAGHKNIYCYETYDDKDYWEMAVRSDIRITFMRSFNNYIYCMQSYFRALYRFRPGIDDNLHHVASFSYVPAAMCNTGDCLTVFTHNECLDLTVERYSGEADDEKPRVISTGFEKMKVNDATGSCSLVMTMPPLYKELPQYHSQYLMQHNT